MSEDKKICPFMSHPIQSDNKQFSDYLFLVECREGKCMAWGVVDFIKITDDKENVTWGCKLIERPQ